MNNHLIGIKSLVSNLAQTEQIHDDEEMDRLVLGIDLNRVEREEQLRISDEEQITHEPTPYYFIKTFLDFFKSEQRRHNI